MVPSELLKQWITSDQSDAYSPILRKTQISLPPPLCQILGSRSYITPSILLLMGYGMISPHPNWRLRKSLANPDAALFCFLQCWLSSFIHPTNHKPTWILVPVTSRDHNTEDAHTCSKYRYTSSALSLVGSTRCSKLSSCSVMIRERWKGTISEDLLLQNLKVNISYSI